MKPLLHNFKDLQSPGDHLIGVPVEPAFGIDRELQHQIQIELENDRFRKNDPPQVAMDQRHEERHDLNLPAVCFSISSDQQIEVEANTSCVLADISNDGLKLIVNVIPPQAGRHLVVGVDSGFGAYQFACVKVVGVNRNRTGRIIVNCQFGGPLQKNIFNRDKLFPEFDRKKMKFVFSTSHATMASLLAIGAVEPISKDWIEVCPRCDGVPTFRKGCAKCLSGNVTESKMIHHFGCSDSDLVHKFECETDRSEAEVRCQACGSEGLVECVDFKYLDYENVCHDCGQANDERVPIGQCLDCDHRFKMNSAKRLELVRYKVHRLAPENLVNNF